MNKVVLYCRPGFEKECAAEITDKAAKREIFGFARVKNAGYVVFECYQPEDADKLARELPFSSLILRARCLSRVSCSKTFPGRPHHANRGHAAGRGGEGRRSSR